MRRFGVLGFGLLFTVSGPVPVVSQETPSRQGVWYAAGFGGALGNIRDCGGCDLTGTSLAISGIFRVGGTPGEQWLAGAEAGWWLGKKSGTTAGFVTVSFLGFFYPMPDRGLHFSGGVGGMLYRENASRGDVAANGVMWRLSAGYDVRIRENVSISPYLNYIRAPGLDEKFNRLPVFNTPDLDLLQFGVAIVRH